MFNVILALGAFVGALLMGAGLLSMWRPNQRWRAFARADAASADHASAHPRAFETLKMAPFPLAWPSEVERPSSPIVVLPWPSETWDDPTFGISSREDVRRIERTAEAIDKKRDRFRRQTAAQRREADAKEAAGVKVQRARRAAEREERVEEGQRREHRPAHTADALVIEAPPVQAPPVQAPPVQAPPPASDGTPTPQEVAVLVKEHGLAGAVEQIRVRTGWDFRQAAQFLAETLRNR